MSAPQPRAVQIDASTHCQLACPVCPTADGRTRPGLGRGHLRVSDFEALLDNNPELLEVELSNYGEMFLNPQLPLLLEAAHRRGVVVSGNNGVNLNFASDAALEAVVRYRVRGLTCSIDGATPATYALYRRNGHLESVLRNIDRILEFKRRFNTAFPLLFWQFVVFGHNEHELEQARSMAAERGMEFVPRISWNAEHSPIQNSSLVTIQTGLGAATRDEFKEKHGQDYTRNLCYQLWQAPVVNWDGKLLGCCVNYWGDFGANVFEQNLAQSSQTQRMREARAMLTGESGPVQGVPCTTCDQYQSLRQSRRWLTPQEIESHPKQQYLLSILPQPAPGMRFAKISLATTEQLPGERPRPTAGRVFRFGVDQAVLSRLSGPGNYRVQADVLTAQGWHTYESHIAMPERPTLHEVELDLEMLQRTQPVALNRQSGSLLECWIR